VYITKGSRTDRTPKSREDTSHLTLLAKDSEGYQNLMLLVSKGFTEGFYYDPRIDKDLLSKHHEGLIALSGCINSHVAIPCLENNIELACRQAAEYRDIMGNDNFYIELMDHGLEDEKKAIPGLLEVSKRTSIPAVATNDCHYPHKEDWEAHDAHICISTGSFIDDPKRLKFGSNEFYFKSPEEMIKLFSYMPKAVSNTIDIAERCHVKIATDKLFLPHFDVPGNFRGLTVDEYLEKRCHDGLKIKLGGDIAANYAERLKYELSVIKKMGFSSYFLIVEDFIAREHDVAQKIPCSLKNIDGDVHVFFVVAVRDVPVLDFRVEEPFGVVVGLNALHVFEELIFIIITASPPPVFLSIFYHLFYFFLLERYGPLDPDLLDLDFFTLFDLELENGLPRLL